MLNLFRKKRVPIVLFEKMVDIAEMLGNEKYIRTEKSKYMMEYEYFIYLFSLTDHLLRKWGFQDIEIDNLTELYIDITQNSERWLMIRCQKSFVRNRIKNYIEILSSLEVHPKQSYELLLNYQIQLFISIISFDSYSEYNPLPKSPSEYSPIIVDPILTLSISTKLSERLCNVEAYIEYLKRIKNIWN